MCFFLYIFLSSYSSLKTYFYYTHIEIYNNKNSKERAEWKNKQQWRLCSLFPKLPTCSLAASVLQGNAHTREGKMAATFSLYSCESFFSASFSCLCFHSTKPQHSFT
jgi:hypothetical protein